MRSERKLEQRLSARRDQAVVLGLMVFAIVTLAEAAPCFHTIQLPDTGKNANEFRVVVFSDLHYGERAGLDAGSAAAQALLLDHHRPALVVYDGDLAMALEKAPGEPRDATCNNVSAARCWAEAVGPAISRGLPFVATAGNHDFLHDESELQQSWALERAAAAASARSLSCNRSFSVVDITDAAGLVAMRFLAFSPTVRKSVLWEAPLFTTGDPAPADDALDDLERYIDSSEGVVDAVALVHIPLAPMMSLTNVRGSWGEPVSCMDNRWWRTRRFQRLLQHRGSGVRAVISGHDHSNDFMGVDPRTGITYMYTRKSGNGGYAGLNSGARVLVGRRGFSESAADDALLGNFFHRTAHYEWRSWIASEAEGLAQTQGRVQFVNGIEGMRQPRLGVCDGVRDHTLALSWGAIAVFLVVSAVRELVLKFRGTSSRNPSWWTRRPPRKTLFQALTVLIALALLATLRELIERW